LTTWHELKKGAELELEIKENGRDGHGVARYNGCIIIVKGAVAGDFVKARITNVGARHAYAVATGKAKVPDSESS